MPLADLLNNIDVNDMFAKEIESIGKKKPTMPTQENIQEMISLIRESISVEFIHKEKMAIIMIVVDKEEANNFSKNIHCGEGICFAGYVHDLTSDSYVVDCVDFVSLGIVSASFKISMPNSGGWKMQIPLPEKLVESLIAPHYQTVVKAMKHKYSDPRYCFQYIQMISCQ